MTFQTLDPNFKRKETPTNERFLLSFEKPYNLYPFKEEKWVEPHVYVKRRQQRIPYVKKKTWAPLLFCILALVALLTSCFRAGHVKILSFNPNSRSINTNTNNKGRRLAKFGGQRGKGDDDDEAGILEMCLDLQETTGFVAPPFPLTHDKAIPLILQFLNEPSPQQAFNGSSPSAPLVSSSSTAPFTQPGPTYIAASAAGWRPFESSSSGRYQASNFLRETSMPLWQPAQSLSPFFIQSQQEEPTMSEPAAAPNRPENQWEPGEPPPRKNTFCWETKELLPAVASAASGFLEQQQQLAGLNGESVGDDPLLKAIQAVREEYSPPPLNIPESIAETAEETGLFLNAVESLPIMPRTPPLHLFACKKPPSTLSSPAEEGEEDLFLLDPPGLSTSERIRQALPAPAQDKEAPLPGLSRASAAFAPLSSYENGEVQQQFHEECGEVQQQSESASSALLPRRPAASQLQPETAHPFYRLPVLLPGQQVTRQFNVDYAFSKMSADAVGLLALKEMRSILKKMTITSDDLVSLIYNSEIIAGRLVKELQLPIDPTRPSRAVYRLGRSFLSLDALISTIEFLGPAMNANQWWQTIEKKIPPKVIYPYGKRSKFITQVHAALATDLSSALQTLRHCTRLTEMETIGLKRRLLCKEDTVGKFKQNAWNPWREDDAKSGAFEQPNLLDWWINPAKHQA